MRDKLITLVSIGLIWYGFRLATQAGMELKLQNDGYAMSGGLLILLGGIGLGIVLNSYLASRINKQG